MDDDLLGVVCTYATTKVTLDLLTSFAPLNVYNSHTWRRKVLYEARGLVMNDALVETGGWYAYYLYQNRSYYGDVLSYSASHGFFRSPELPTAPVIFFHTELSPFHTFTVVQYENYEVTITVNNNRMRFTQHARIRSAGYTLYGIILVDEYGDAWRHGEYDDPHSINEEYAAHIGSDIVGVVASITRYILLDRGGRMSVYHGGVFVLTTPKRVVLVASSDVTERVYAVTNDGTLLTMSTSTDPERVVSIATHTTLQDVVLLSGGRSHIVPVPSDEHLAYAARDTYVTTKRIAYMWGVLDRTTHLLSHFVQRVWSHRHTRATIAFILRDLT